MYYTRSGTFGWETSDGDDDVDEGDDKEGEDEDDEDEGNISLIELSPKRQSSTR
jgi:hypothetical protein